MGGKHSYMLKNLATNQGRVRNTDVNVFTGF